MAHTQIRDFIVDNAPLIAVFVSIFSVIGWWLLKNVVLPYVQKVAREKQEAWEKTKRLQYDNNLVSIRLLHKNLQTVLRSCVKKGYRTTYDSETFGAIYSDYLRIGGNHDGELMYKDFEKLQLKNTIQLPIDNGFLSEDMEIKITSIFQDFMNKNKNLFDRGQSNE